MQNDQDKKTINGWVLEAADSFKGSQQRAFLGKVLNLINEKTDLATAQKVCKRIPIKYDHFPSLKELDELIYECNLERPQIVAAHAPFVSLRAPGTPACLEALFRMIEDGRTECGAFQFGMQYCGFKTDKELFDSYELWVKGMADPKRKFLDGQPYMSFVHVPRHEMRLEKLVS